MVRLINLLTSLLLFCGLFSTAAHADQELNDLQIFKRCYIRLLRQVPDLKHDLYLAVKNGTMKGPAACLALFDEAEIGANGYLVNRTQPEARRILKTFHDLHRSWFQGKVNLTFKTMSYLARDGEEDALYFTQAAFQNKKNFNSVVLSNTGLKGRRDRIVGGETGSNFQAQSFLSYSDKVPYAGSMQALISYVNDGSGVVQAVALNNSQMTEVGELVGVAPASKIIFPSYSGLHVAASSVPSEAEPLTAAKEINKVVAGFTSNIDVTAHYGGGILGSQTFLLNNTNLARAEVTQGAAPAGFAQEAGEAMINRRISNRFFEDVLCHQLPTLLPEDVKNEVNTKSELTFRREVSCQTCHAQNDGTAKIMRNLYVSMSAGGGDGTSIAGMPMIFVGALPASPTANAFALTPAAGRLYYRQMLTGEKVDEQVSSLEQIGKIIASKDDLYRCAAKRYYKFFTGVDVSLSGPAVKPIDKAHQDTVLELAKELKADQSVRKLIARIFKSAAFKSSNYLSESL